MYFIIFFIPFIISYFLTDTTALFMLSWIGSTWLIIYSNYIENGLKPSKIKFFSPLILSQGLFWGYTALTSIFYFFDQLGYEFFEHVDVANIFELEILAKTQRYILFGHSCYIFGYFLYEKKIYEKNPEYRLKLNHNSYLKFSIVASILAIIVIKTPLAQLSSYLNIFSTICAVKFLGYALSYRKILFKAILYFVAVMSIGFFTGMKENTLFPLIYLGVILYDKYGIRRTTLIFAPIIIAYFYFIPTINGVVRNAIWYDNKNAGQTFDLLNDANLYDSKIIKNNNWKFLSTRLSEISMLNRYIESVPYRRPFYGLEIIKDGLLSLVPRAIWPSKQSPDFTAQKRAVDNGALVLNSPYDFTSAKPQTIADAYISYGYPGIFLTFVIFGFLVHYLYVLLKNKFGYEFGGSILFYSIFNVLSKGGCFENLFNTTFYGFILIFIVTHIFKRLNIIEPNPNW